MHEHRRRSCRWHVSIQAALQRLIGRTLPDSLFGGSSADSDGLLPGTVVSVSTSDGTPLYSYTVGTDASGDSTSPVASSGTTMNTGNIPFQQQPVYISNSPSGQGTTIFGGTP